MSRLNAYACPRPRLSEISGLVPARPSHSGLHAPPQVDTEPDQAPLKMTVILVVFLVVAC